MQGGTSIFTKASGRVNDFQGNDNYIFGEEIVAGKTAFFDTFLGLAKTYFK